MTYNLDKHPYGPDMQFDLAIGLPKVDEKDDSNLKRRFQVPKRYILTVMCFLGTLNFIAVRLNLSVAIIAMVTSGHDESLASDECPRENFTRTENKTIGEFSWDAQTQGYILGGYYYGYTVIQIPGGLIAQRLGGKRTFGAGLVAMGLFSLLTPPAARLHVYALIATRVLLGVAAGVGYPGIHVLLGKWAPPREKGRLSSVVFAAIQLGPVISQALSGVLVESSFLGGWPSAFYVMGFLACVTSVAWMLIVSETPAEHGSITYEERHFIETRIKPVSKKAKTPWPAIFQSVPFWALVITRVCASWGLYMMFSYLPTYIEQVLHLSVTQSGFLSALPYLVCWIVVLAGGFLSDFLLHHGLSTLTVRKLMNTLGLVLPAGFMAAVGYTGCNIPVTILFLALCVGLNGLTFTGYFINHIDLSPQHSGILFGLANSFGSATGFAVPYLVGFILEERQSQAEWRIVFFVCAGVYALGAAVFLLFADAEPQPWSIGNLLVAKFSAIKSTGLSHTDLQQFAENTSVREKSAEGLYDKNVQMYFNTNELDKSIPQLVYVVSQDPALESANNCSNPSAVNDFGQKLGYLL